LVHVKTLVQLTNLMAQASSFPDDRAEAHPLVLDAVLRAVDVPARGWMGIKTGTAWAQTAGDVLEWLDPDLGGALRAEGRCVMGRFDTDCGVRIGLLLELQEPGDTAWTKTVVKIGLAVTAAYEAASEARRRARALEEQTRQLLDLAAALSSTLYSDETFYSELLRAAIAMIPEAEGGSIAQLKEGTWRFVAAVGHEPGLLDLVLPTGSLGIHPEPAVVDGVLSGEPGTVSGVRDVLRAVSSPIAKTLIVTLDVGPGHLVNVALDIPLGSRQRFGTASLEVFQRLTGLVRSFLLFRSQKAAADWANRRLTEKLAQLAEAHDLGTAEHNTRVAAISARLAVELGLCSEDVEAIREGAVLHDIGKLFLDPALLNKTTALSADERHRVRQHTLWAEKLLDDPYFEVDQKIAVYHHERFDGLGYPKGLKGDQIPIEAQIVSVADVYDALRSSRSYKSELPAEEALRRMTEGDERTPAGAFNPIVLAALRACVPELEPLWTPVRQGS
jgi:HD-GYP domain-containing protein (c-di-GMP phosphodiesterase class II)